MSEPTKIFSSQEPKQWDRPGARKFIVGDEWHNDDVVRVWDGRAWQLKEKQIEEEAAQEENKEKADE